MTVMQPLSRIDFDTAFVDIVQQQQPGRALDQVFYTDPAIFERDIDRIFMRHWLCVGHESALPKPGDFVTLEVAREPIIVVRGKDHVLRALVNVCRHRGSRVCAKPSGNANVFVCPYHAWTYDLEGKLRAIPHAGELSAQLADPDGGLREVHLRVAQGLVFVSFADEPLGFDRVAKVIDASHGPYGWGEAKVAHRETYEIAANWKLAVENYVECYHCAPSHPEYALLHALAQPLEKTAALNAAMEARTAACGISIDPANHWDNSAEAGEEAIASFRYALYEGMLSGADRGKPVAPLMGRFTNYDGGVTATHVGPASFLVAYADYGVIYRFVPKTLQTCEMELIWLVNQDAQAGVDYDLEKLTWLWRVTSEADKRIVGENQRGVNSRFYQPGPFAPMEYNEQRYVAWYLREII